MGPHLLLYDGVCGLCNRLNRFVLKRDKRDAFRFASLQSPVGRGWVERFGENPDELTTFYVVADYATQPRLLRRSRAALFVLRELGGIWRAAGALRIVPLRLADACYRFVARRRYRWFGEYDSCPMPAPAHRAKFLDLE